MRFIFRASSRPISELGGQIDTFVPCGVMAGVMAGRIVSAVYEGAGRPRCLIERGGGTQLDMTDAENGLLNPLGINCCAPSPCMAGGVGIANDARRRCGGG